jgi:hypothetical protein
MARRAHNLQKLLAQVDAAYPRRSRISDGWIGDAAHRNRPSDHNPNAKGVVQAIDITHDADGVGDDLDTWKFADMLQQKKDRRIKNVISNSRIFAGNAAPQPWVWRPYTGANNHARHVHVSVADDPTLHDDARLGHRSDS